MNILLIKPPNRGFAHYLRREVPIGPAYLASALRHRGHDVSLFDALAFRNDNHVVTEYIDPIEREKVSVHPRFSKIVHWGAHWERIDAAIAQSNADIVGISSMFSCYYTAAYEVARRARRLLPQARILLGGPHATSMYDHALAEPAIDVVVLGEAETRVAAIVEALGRGDDMRDFEGLAFRCGESFCTCSIRSSANHVRPQESWLADLDSLALPAADLLDFTAYGPRTTLITSRGCPFSCSFCSVHATVGKRFRARAPECVVDEIEWYINNFGVTAFNIEDDNFTFDMDRVDKICQTIIGRGLKIDIALPNGITVLKLTSGIAEKMVRAGFSELFLGLETTDSSKLREIQKGFASFDKAASGVEAFRNLGVEPQVSLIVGLPGQRPENVAADVAAMIASKIKMSPSAYYPVVGAPDYAKYLQAGFRKDPALLEGFGFNRTSSMSSHEMYWTWVATVSCGMFDELILDGRKGHSQGGHVNPMDVIRAAMLKMQHATGSYRTGFSMGHRTSPAIRFAAKPDWTSSIGSQATLVQEATFLLARQWCICGAQNLRIEQRAEKIEGACQVFGDYVAMAAALITGTPLTSEEVACSVAGGQDSCQFILRTDPAVNAVITAFTAAIDAELARIA